MGRLTGRGLEQGQLCIVAALAWSGRWEKGQGGQNNPMQQIRNPGLRKSLLFSLLQTIWRVTEGYPEKSPLVLQRFLRCPQHPVPFSHPVHLPGHSHQRHHLWRDAGRCDRQHAGLSKSPARDAHMRSVVLNTSAPPPHVATATCTGTPGGGREGNAALALLGCCTGARDLMPTSPTAAVRRGLAT